MLVRGARHWELWRLQASIYLQNKPSSDRKGTFSFLLCSCLCLEREMAPRRGVPVSGPHSFPSLHLASRRSGGNCSLCETQLGFCQFILPSLLNCHQVLMTLGFCQPGFIRAGNTVPRAFLHSLHWPSLEVPAFSYEEVGFN